MSRRVPPWFKKVGAIAIALVIGMPVTFIGTFFLSPLWSWIEERYGIESMGHSGPSDWCFFLIYTIWCVGALAAILWPRRAAPPPVDA